MVQYPCKKGDILHYFIIYLNDYIIFFVLKD